MAEQRRIKNASAIVPQRYLECTPDSQNISCIHTAPDCLPGVPLTFNLGIVHFSAGAMNKMHTHTSDQVLFVTAGTGIIATETHQEIIHVGDASHSG